MVCNGNRLAGAVLIAPVVNFWWTGFLANLSEVYNQQYQRDQWSLRVAHYAPWLTYWWNTQKWFPYSSVVAKSRNILSRQDKEIVKLPIRQSRKEYEVLTKLLFCSVNRNCYILFFCGK